MNRPPVFAALAALLMPITAVHAGSPSTPGTLPPPPPPPPRLRLPGGPRPVRQAIQLEIHPGRETFSGEVDIEIKLPATTSFLWLNGRELRVRQATVQAGGRTIGARVHAGGEDFLGFAFARPLGPGPITLRVAYEGVLNRKDTRGVFAQQDGDDWYVFTQFEATDARRAFPAFDEPSYKIPWQVTLRVARDLQALSNTPEASTVPSSEELKTVRFTQTPPMPSYLVAFAVGPFELVDAGKGGRKGTPLRIVTPRGRAAEARWAKEATPHILKHLEDYFDQPYPYAKLDQIAVPFAVAFGAMENVGLVTYQQAFLLRKPEEEAIAFRRTYASIAAHELAHMWFGNLVTSAWWDDIWLNEAFASWMADKVGERWKPEWDVAVDRVESRSAVMWADALVSARRIRQPIDTRDDIVNAFDGITYKKGQAVLEMFESWLGEETFRQGVLRYLKAHEWQVASAADFLSALEAAAGRGASGAFGTFLDQSGLPLVSVRLTCGEGGPRLWLEQQPYRQIGSRDRSPRRWTVPICVRYGGEVSGRQCTLLASPSSELALETGGRCPAWVLPNDGGAGYYRVAYEGDLLDRLMKDGGRMLSVPERVSVLGDLAALVRSGQVKVAEALEVVPAVRLDPSRQVVAATAGLIDQATQDAVPDAARPKRARFIREVYGERARALGWTPRPGEDEDTRLLRRMLVALVAQQGEEASLIAQARTLTDRWLADPTAGDPDLLPSVLQTAARNGDRALFERFRAAAREASEPVRRKWLRGALAAFRDPALVPEVVALAFDDKLDLADVRAALAAGGEEQGSRRLAWEAFKRRYDELLPRLAEEAREVLPYAGRGACDAEFRADIESFFRPRVGRLPGAPRNLEQVLEQADLCIAYREAQQASLMDFLQRY